MDWAGWAVFGLVATVVLTGIMVAAQLAGLSRMDLPMILGVMFFEDPDRGRIAGAFVHMLNGYLFALLYAAAFAALEVATWWVGALFGLVHGLAALILIVPLIPGVHPRMASERSGPAFEVTLEPPGLLGLNYGRQTPAVALVAHVVYGITLGTFLAPG